MTKASSVYKSVMACCKALNNFKYRFSTIACVSTFAYHVDSYCTS